MPSEELGELDFVTIAVCRQLTMALIVQQASPPAAVEQRDAEGVLQLKGSIASVSEAVTGVGPCQLSGRICDCSKCLWGQLIVSSKRNCVCTQTAGPLPLSASVAELP